MAKIDKIKEALITLRVAFTVLMAIMVTICGSLVSSYRQDSFDIVFWIGVFFEFAIMISLLFVIKKIKRKTDEIGDL